MTALSDEQKRKIAGRGRTLQERLDVRAEADETIDDLDGAVEKWRDYVADDDPEAFRKRLSYEDVDFEECRKRIATNGWPSDEPLPDWVERLDDILRYVKADPTVDRAFDADDEIPFVHVLSPFLQYARDSVDRVPSDRIAQSAMDDLTDWLGNRLTKLAAHTLFIEFKTHVAERDPDLVFEDDVEIDGDPRKHYREFTEKLLSEDLESFFLEYSFLGRLLVESIRQWVTTVEEFRSRIADDWADIEDTFSDGELGAVTAVDALGDPHHGGQRVLGVTFDSGAQVAYKPRNSGIVVGFYDLLDWINEHSDLPELRTLSFVSRDGHAWMEWVQPEPCSTEEEVESYYRRAGMLVCVFYALDATDMHLENIVAVGDQPVAIDLETLAQPMVKPKKRSVHQLVEVMTDTVLRTGTVPEHHPSSEIGGNLAGFSAEQASLTLEIQNFTATNTDLMDLEKSEETKVVGENLPRHDGEVVRPQDHVEAIARGFRELYRFVLDNKSALLADEGPIERLTDRETRMRVLYRDTRVYNYVKNTLESHSYHRTGLEFGLKVETLARLIVSEDIDQEVWPIYEAERDVLRRANVPRFSVRIDSTDIEYRGEPVVEDFFGTKPIDHVRERVRNFSESDLDEQLDYVRWGYGNHGGGHGGADAGELDADPTRASVPFEQSARATSLEIFERIVENSRTEDGVPTWILREVSPTGGMHVHGIEDRLYDGRVGVAVFVAALDRVFDDDEYGEFAREVVSPILEQVDDSELSADESIGGAVGLGSIVYGLTKTGELLGSDRHVRAAEEAAALLTPEAIENDAQYDALQGSAGAILGLLALYERTGSRDVLDRAARAGDHLLESQTRYDGVPAWRPAEFERPLCGFAHGVAGIAYALSRLGEATGESRFKTAALESIEYERRQYDETVRNWPDLRSVTENRWMDAWCHGRTGVGLARLGMHEVDPAPELREDIDRALGGTDPAVMTDVDHVCCGNFGRVELLLEAARRLGEPTYRDEAERLAAASLQRADAAGQFTTRWQTDHWYNPSLFDGEAGIGYALLRMVDESIPCVLLWE